MGRTDGTIVEPQGTGGFGWDAIFIPNGQECPFADMSQDGKNAISHRARALALFVAHCKAHEDEMTKSIVRARERARSASPPP